MKIRTKRADPGQKAGGPRFLVLAAAWIALALAANCAYLYTEWHRYGAIMAAEAIALAESLETLIHPEHIANIEGKPSDTETRRYRLVKNSLGRLTSTNTDIQYAYLVAGRGERIIYLADSLDAFDPAAKMPGDLCPEATDAYRAALAAGKSALIPRINDTRGSWMRALVPVTDVTTGLPIALFGIDYTADAWYARVVTRMHPDFVVSGSLILLSFALVFAFAAHVRLRVRSDQIAMEKALLHSVFDQAPIGIAISSQTTLVHRLRTDSPGTNSMFEQIFGRGLDELTALKWTDIPSDGIERLFAGETSDFAMERKIGRPDGSEVWINLMLSRLAGAPFEGSYLCLVENITARREAEEALRESERSKAVLLSHLPGMAYRCRYDPHWTMEFVSEGCKMVTGYEPDELIGNRVRSFAEVIDPAYRDLLWNEWAEVARRDANFRFEYEIVKKDGARRWVLELGQPIKNALGEVAALEGIIIDITGRVLREREIAYLSERDYLTGLYNRRYIVEAAARMEAAGILPVSVAIVNINGVRMVNFAFGNGEGDRLIAGVGQMISACGRVGDLVGRTGGDEFTLLLPGADMEEAGRIARRIEEAVERYNRADSHHPYEVSLSVGYDTKAAEDVRIEQVIKDAGEHLMHAKLLNHKSSHSALLSSIMATLYARDHETEEHGQRLARYARMIGEALGFAPKEMDDLQLLSMLHDIGKVGIDDRILGKPAALTDEEREAMKKHSEIGHRIALSSPELEHIAEYILFHHERWDGAGYPAGLRGELIPLHARILAVCDAYDAMTEDRVYRRAMPKHAALAEIARHAGTQFDPQIARLFIALMDDGTGEGENA